MKTLVASCLAAALLAAAAAPLAAADAARRFDALVSREWQWRLQEFPTFATSVGVHTYDDRLEDASPRPTTLQEKRPLPVDLTWPSTPITAGTMQSGVP